MKVLRRAIFICDRSHRAVFRCRSRVRRIGKIVNISEDRSRLAEREPSRNPRELLRIGCQEEPLKRCHRGHTTMKFPRTFGEVKTANHVSVERKRRMAHILIKEGNVPVWSLNLV